MLTWDEAVRLFERRRDAWLAEDLDAYLALFAPGLEFRSPVHAEPLGHAAFADLVRASNARMRPVSFDFERLAVHGDDVLAEWRIRIAERATGRIVEYSGMSACRIAGGLIAWWREYWDPAELGLRR
ncbi:MAG TPA: nuclear transport factor 2 family protein [Candidatus Binatia bacterium]|nr:nuclear transport factor 2 family protein [Candidatus Binatia bacterium]